MADYFGYHGTDNEAAQKIVDGQCLNPSIGEDEWLGRGAYFFKYPDDACWWCQTHKRLQQYTLLEAQISPAKIIDLLGSRIDIENFKIFCDKVKNKSSRLSNGCQRKNYMSLAIKLMIRNSDDRPDMIIAGFDQNRKKWFSKASERQKFPMVCAQVQYCVINLDCIHDIQKASYE